MKRILVLSMLALTVGGLAACSTERLTDPTPTAESDRSNGTTIAQWASVIAEQQANLADWKTDWDADLCSVDASDFVCGVGTLTGTYVAQTISIKLQTAVTSTALKGYLADEPPAEILALWTDTRTAADDFMGAGKAWTDSCNADSGAPGCDALLFKFGSAADHLETKFAAWSPYL